MRADADHKLVSVKSCAQLIPPRTELEEPRSQEQELCQHEPGAGAIASSVRLYKLFEGLQPQQLLNCGQPKQTSHLAKIGK